MGKVTMVKSNVFDPLNDLTSSSYHLVMTNSAPWEVTMLLSSVNHLFQWANYTMANCQIAS